MLHPTRSLFRRTAAYLTLSALASLLVSAAAPASGLSEKTAKPARPNIVFIVSDDHSVPFLGCYGTAVKTPNFDRFAAEGMRFDYAFVTSPQCAPSRSSFLLGLSPLSTGVARFSQPTRPDIQGFPEVLRAEAGYFTGICRRAHHLDGWMDNGTTVSREIWARHNLKTAEKRFDFVRMGGSHTDTRAYVDDFLGKVPAGKPYCLWVNFSDPHHPWNAPRANDPAKLPLLAGWPDLPALRDDLGRHCDEITRMDSEFQAVLDAIDARGDTANTLVIFIGDNGMAFPRGKGALHEPGIRIPLLARWPGVLKPGQSTTTLISGEDIAPTIIDAAGLTPPSNMTGRSFAPLLRGETYTPRQYVFAMRGVHGGSNFNETTMADGYDLSRTVRDSRYKLIYNLTPWMHYRPVDSHRDPGWQQIVAAHEAHTLPAPAEQLFFTNPRPIVELYDLQNDPNELQNLAADPAFDDIERRLKIALQEYMIINYDPLPLPLRE